MRQFLARQERAGAAVLLAFVTAVAFAAPSTVFEHAQFLHSARADPPPATAAWEDVSLPHDFGDAASISERVQHDDALDKDFHVLAMAATFTAGLIALLLWFARRTDKVMFWFSIACLSWPLAGALMWLRLHDYQWVYQIAALYVRFGLPIPVFVLCLRIVDKRWPRIEALLWIYFAVEVTYSVWNPYRMLPEIAGHSFMQVAWPTILAMLLVGGAVLLAVKAQRPVSWSHYLEIAVLLAMGGFLLQDLAHYMNWINMSSLAIRSWHVPLMVLALGAAIFHRHVASLWQLEQMNKAREQEIRKAEVLARERQRILADMHDGLGATLIGLLNYVQSGGNDRAAFEARVKEALQELRIAVDALEPSEGDLGTVLGKLRHRIDQILMPCIVRLSWDVGDLPDIEALDPSAVFAIQHIVLEAFANVLQHAQAHNVQLRARPCGTDGVEIVIEDDGRGFVPESAGSGHGIASIKARARRIGAIADVSSTPGKGTTVRLQLPLKLTARLADESA